MRLLFLSCAGAIIFFGFSIPFIVSGGIGLAIGIGTVALGIAAFWYAESKTSISLHADTVWNRTMKADGEDLLDQDGVD